jgi:hypothetical protein
MAIDFQIQRNGRIYSATAGGGSGFFVGIQTQYTDKKTGETFSGLFNVPTKQLPPLLYTADPYRPSQNFWADFIEPTALCEGQNFLTLNTYDRARFTWGFGQFGAHVANGDFVTFFRNLLNRPEKESYFPDLSVVDGHISKVQDGSEVQLENNTSTQALLDYLNPSSANIDDAEVFAAAKLIHWTTNFDDARQMQVAQMVQTFKQHMGEADRRLGLDGKTADICCVICDIRHQGRGTYPVMQTALNSPNPLSQLLQIGGISYPDRVKTLKKAIAARSELFTAQKWSRAAGAFAAAN